MNIDMINTLAKQSCKLSLIAIAIGSVFTPVYADGYGISKVNRTNIKIEKWECKRCKVSSDTQGTVGAGIAYNDAADSHFGNATGTDQDGVVAHLDADVALYGESGYRTSIEANKLGYDNGSAKLSTGKPGQYEVALAIVVLLITTLIER